MMNLLRRIKLFIFRKVIFDRYLNLRKKSLSEKFSNNGLTIISSNCISGCLYSDIGEEFNSPTVNCFFYAECFIKFSDNIEQYLALELKEVSESKYIGAVNYPLGCVGDVEIHFLHYSNFASAQKKWNDRVKRVNLNKICFIMTDRDGCTKEIAKSFLLNNVGNKIIFTTPMFSDEEINDGHIICSSENGSVISSNFTTFRKYEKYIDIVSWLNNV
ncbi:DUF1919 domain-containing protein [Enterovibrio norvegicus]|uniref:DUF1919 domain-containing protein n=1 Tax=Enterovibrio norvegicus TaxID=188144 RepID=UPI0013D1405A|nr:DUF1919 domain-containing protein [Enterovibrio norvegicus]